MTAHPPLPPESGNDTMNRILRLFEMRIADAETLEPDPLDATAGLVWGSFLGGTFWLIAIAIAIIR